MSYQYKYGKVTDKQISALKKKLHASLFWLLIYKDPETSEQYQNVDVDLYFESLMAKIGGLSDILGNPPSLIWLESQLEAAKHELDKDDFNFHAYRKLVLDAHSSVDQMFDESGKDDGNV